MLSPMVKKKKVKKRKKRKKIIVEAVEIEQLNWKEKKPFKYFFSVLGLSGLAIDSFAALMAWAFIIGTFLLVPVIWWDTFTDGITASNIFNNILLTLLLWVCVGFFIEEFEGIKALAYLILLILAGIFLYVQYENIKIRKCVNNFIERPNTFDKKKFIDCQMISESYARNHSLDFIISQMYQKFYNRK